jgi:homogentisate 1,2-dioxygenase
MRILAASRANTMRTFLYRRPPSCRSYFLEKTECNTTFTASFLSTNDKLHVVPSQLSWRAFNIPDKSTPVDWMAGIHTLGGSGHPNLREGIPYHIFAFNTNMKNKAFANIDGDFLILAQEGQLDI